MSIILGAYKVLYILSSSLLFVDLLDVEFMRQTEAFQLVFDHISIIVAEEMLIRWCITSAHELHEAASRCHSCSLIYKSFRLVRFEDSFFDAQIVEAILVFPHFHFVIFSLDCHTCLIFEIMRKSD